MYEKIEDFAHVVYVNHDVFNRKLWKVIEEYQNNFAFVDVQYQTRGEGFSALVIGRGQKSDA